MTSSKSKIMSYKFKFFTLLLLALLSQSLDAQSRKVWSKLYGGDGAELGLASTRINDSLFAIAGSSNSANLGNKGLTDMLIAVINKNGNSKFLKTFGGPQQDQILAMDLLPNGNLVCGGISNGAGGDVNANFGLLDGYLMVYNPLTNTRVWGKNYGGGNNDQINDIKFLETGKILFAGSTKSMSNDIPSNMGLTDAFVGTIDEAGNVVRIKTFAGSKDDFGKKIAKIDEGSFYFGGETVSSNEGAFLGLNNKGKKDIFVIKLNRNTNQLSIFMLGGPGDETLVDMMATADKGVVLVLNVNTSGGDIDSLKGGKDIFVVKYDATGQQVWKRMIGGSKDEDAIAAKLNNAGEILITATSNSNDKDIAANYGDKDVVLIRINDNGDLISVNNYGGLRGEAGGTILPDGTNTYLTSSAFSTNNDLPSTNPGGELWVLNLFDCSKIPFNYVTDVCQGDTIIINGTKYHQTNSTGQFTLPNAGLYGCDSLVNVQVNILPRTSEFLADTLCSDGTITINNVIFDKNKPAHTFLFKNSQGCDSLLNVLLYFNPAIEVTDSMLKSDNGTFNGFIHLVLGGGSPPFSYLWSNGSRTLDLDNIRFGTYTVTVTDHLNCVKEFSFVVKSSVGVKDNFTSSVQISQVQDQIILKANEIIESLNIYTISSQNPVQSERPVNNECRLSTKALVPSIYILEINFSNKRKELHKFSILR